jgi:Na+/proline symporter
MDTKNTSKIITWIGFSTITAIAVCALLAALHINAADLGLATIATSGITAMATAWQAGHTTPTPTNPPAPADNPVAPGPTVPVTENTPEEKTEGDKPDAP